MPPKIEEIPSNPVPNTSSVPKNNPFLSSGKKKTIKQDAKDVYNTDNLRKGLNKPDYIKGTPLDKLFLDLEDKLQGTIDDITLDQLTERIVGKEASAEAENSIRYLVMAKLLDYLLEIQQLSAANKDIEKNLIGISLHDIKTFSKLVNLIIIHGVYPALSTFKIGIPLAKRRLKDFMKTQKPIKMETISQNSASKSYTDRFADNYNLLSLLYDKLRLVFQTESDVKDLLIRGTGYSDFLTISITLITCPYFPKDKKPFYLKDFQEFVLKLPGTYELFQTFSLLLSSQSPGYFKQFVLKYLQLLHYNAPRGDGLLTLVEFVLGLRDNEEINIEKFDNVANVVLLKPKEIPTKDYFTNIGSQIYDILVNINRPNVTSCIGHTVERLWDKNRLVVKDFLLKRIWDTFNPPLDKKDAIGVLTSEKEFNDLINVLISLTQKGMSSTFSQFLFKPIMLTLWAYFVFLRSKKKDHEILMNMLVGYFVSVKEGDDLEKDVYGLDAIAKNLVFEGNNWEIQLGPNDLPQIVESSKELGQDKDLKINKYLSHLDSSCGSFIELLKNLDDAYVLGIFKQLLRRWLRLGSNSETTLGQEDDNPFLVLIDLRLIESIGNEFKEDIAKTPTDMLEIVDEFLSIEYSNNHKLAETKIIDSEDEPDSDDEEEFDANVNSQARPVLLELLSAVLTEVSDNDLTEESRGLLKKVLQKLTKLTKDTSHPVSPNDLKSINSLASRIQLMLSGDIPSNSVRELHAKTLSRAIASLNDPLVPIRAHGLYLLRQLIEAKSEVLSIEFTIELHLIQLKDPEPFVYLNVIKGLESLIELDELEVIKTLTKIYTNEETNQDVDDRLKIGEVLLRYIQASNEMFSGKVSDIVVGATISMIRRSNDESQNQDIRIRMSSMSLLGTCCKVNPLGMLDRLTDALDCAIGILQLETKEELAVMRRSAVVLIHDLILGTSNTAEVPFPEDYRQKVLDVLRYVVDTDKDILTREQAQNVLDDIQELVELAYESIN